MLGNVSSKNKCQQYSHRISLPLLSGHWNCYPWRHPSKESFEIMDFYFLLTLIQVAALFTEDYLGISPHCSHFGILLFEAVAHDQLKARKWM